jgi:prepilin-type N-terminal cleavage/methylation domain-containing protein
LLYKSRRCNSRAGFTLLECMVAFAAASIILVVSISVIVEGLSKQAAGEREVLALALARALLDEYVHTYPLMASSGVYSEKWAWYIEEKRVRGLRETMLDERFEFVEVTSFVSLFGSPGETAFSLSAVVARAQAGAN